MLRKEICDYINTSNTKSLIDYIVTKHFYPQEVEPTNPSNSSQTQNPTLEEVATPYVDTLTLLREKYEEMSKGDLDFIAQKSKFDQDTYGPGSMRERAVRLSERAMEDQVSKFVTKLQSELYGRVITTSL